jgi:hypothetical protein
MNYKYIAKKLFNQYEIYKLKKYEIDDNLYLKNMCDQKIRTIMLYFPDYQFMHFGDHLFFEPLARELQNEGYTVYIFPIKAMEFYFKKLCYKLGNENLIESVDLVITKVEFIPKLLKLNNQILFIDTATSEIKLPLCFSLIKKVFTFLGKNYSDCCDVPSSIVGDGLNIKKYIDKEVNYILFNNYLDSGFFRSGKKHQNMIVKYVQYLKHYKEYNIIHTGSQKDKDTDPNRYEYIDIDLRGLTSIEDMFYLSSLQNIKYNVSFDGFQMHLFFIHNKKSFILFRGRFLKKNYDYLRNYVNPPFFYKGELSDLIEYIE